MTEEKDTVPIECKHCGYDWDTASTKVYVTCSSCLRKTPNPRHEDE